MILNCYVSYILQCEDMQDSLQRSGCGLWICHGNSTCTSCSSFFLYSCNGGRGYPLPPQTSTVEDVPCGGRGCPLWR